MHIYLVCFDITDNKIRDQVGKALLEYGDRVQKSVFEIVLRRPEQLQDIRDRLRPLLQDGDDLRFYRLCADCRQASTGIRGEQLAHQPAVVLV
jgi:CRISPR-associated protein Cas2